MPDRSVTADAESSADAAPAVDDTAPTAADGAEPARPVADVWDHPMPGPPFFTGATMPGQVSVNPAMVLGHLGSSYVGFSFEKTHLTDRFFTVDNAPLVAMFKLLGPGVVRLGGHDVDKCTWDPTAQPMTGNGFGTSVGTAAVDALAEFLRATGWRVIYGVNLKTGTAPNAAAEALYASGKLGPSLYGFEIGNEINAFGLGYDALRTKWESFAAAIRAAVPGAQFIGPATSQSGLSVALSFAHDEASRVRLLTHHYYRGSGGSPSATMDTLLSPNPEFAKVMQQLSMAVRTNQIADGYRMGETNSFSSHGRAGVSDAFGAALWGIDYMFDNAENGASGVNFHGGATGMDGSKPFYYAPIKETGGTVTGVAPLFAGLLLVALAAPGDVLAVSASAGNLNFVTHAVRHADGAVDVVLINKNASTGVAATIALGAPVMGASAISLEAPALTATTGVKLAGAEISATGAWSPQPARALAPMGDKLPIVVPPASVVLVHAR
jgi:hypothetical protein